MKFQKLYEMIEYANVSDKLEEGNNAHAWIEPNGTVDNLINQSWAHENFIHEKFADDSENTSSEKLIADGWIKVSSSDFGYSIFSTNKANNINYKITIEQFQVISTWMQQNNINKIYIDKYALSKAMIDEFGKEEAYEMFEPPLTPDEFFTIYKG